MKKTLFILTLITQGLIGIAQTKKSSTIPAKFYLDSISVVEIPELKRGGIHYWDSDMNEEKYPDLFLRFGKSGVPFSTDTSKDPEKDIRNNAKSYPQNWNFSGKNIELRNENWRVWLYDDEGGAGEMMFASENVNPTLLKSPLELTKNVVQGEQPGFKIKVYFSKR